MVEQIQQVDLFNGAPRVRVGNAMNGCNETREKVAMAQWVQERVGNAMRICSATAGEVSG